MFEDLKKYSRIVVVGPQRSGTHITALMIANDTGHKYFVESTFRNTNTSQFKDLLRDNVNCVIQAPNMSNICHGIDTLNTIVVFMIKDLNDIIASQNRIKWNKVDSGVYANFKKVHGLHNLDLNQPIAKVRHDAWEYQKKLMKVPYIEVQYEDLSAHPLWVKKEDRWSDIDEFKQYDKIEEELKRSQS